MVEVRETVEEVVVQVPDEALEPTPTEPPLFAGVPEDDLLQYGVPEDWLSAVRCATDSSLFDLADHLPQEAMEALLELATGGTPEVAPVPVVDDPFQHPDALRRFRIMDNAEELAQALEYPWEKWTVFLHPTQRQYVQRDYNGPARVTGTAGTGKTVVALHRTVWLAKRHPGSRVLLTTFSDALGANLRLKLDRMVADPMTRGRIDVKTMQSVGIDLYRQLGGAGAEATDADISTAIQAAISSLQTATPSRAFIEAEWHEVVDVWNLTTWERYRDVPRLGRKTRIGGKQREALWAVFEKVRADLTQDGLMTLGMIFAEVTDQLTSAERPYDFAVVDEAQDLGVPELRFLAAMGANRPDALFFTGDLGQRIFQTPFSWRSLGVDVRGRSYTLRINYRTSHQIRRQADRLLPTNIADVDGVSEDRRGAISVFNGAAPTVQTFDTGEDETSAVSSWISSRVADGVSPGEIGVFVRSENEFDRAESAVNQSVNQWAKLTDEPIIDGDRVAIGTMHLAKGLEFRAVAVMACDDEVFPSQTRIESVADDADLEEVYNTERHLLYVACTRARDFLWVSGVEPASEFLDDLAVGRPTISGIM